MTRIRAAVACLLALAGGASADIVIGMGAGGLPQVSRYTAGGGLVNSFLAYTPSFTGGVRVATGDVNGDGMMEIVTGAGPGGQPQVGIFAPTGGTINAYPAYGPTFTGGIFVGTGDWNRDGIADVVTGPGSGSGPNVRVLSGSTSSQLASFDAFGPSFTGGVRVAAGDVNGDGFADVIAGAGPGGGPQVSVISGANGSQLSSFFAYDAGFSGGVFVAAGDVDGDGRADIITGADAGGSPHVKVFSGSTGELLQSFFAYSPNFAGGVRVAVGDVNGDGTAEIITGAGPGAGPHVKVFSGQSGAELQSFFAGDPSFQGGVYVAAIPGPAAGLPLALGAGLLCRRPRRS
jgi:hypothetical protein